MNLDWRFYFKEIKQVENFKKNSIFTFLNKFSCYCSNLENVNLSSKFITFKYCMAFKLISEE